MKETFNPTESYATPTIEYFDIEAKRMLMQTSPSGENPGAIGSDFNYSEE